MPQYKYIDRFQPLADQYPMLAFLFPSSRQITSALGALNAATVGISSGAAIGDSIGSNLDQLDGVSSRTLCLVLGDGRHPRTAIVAAIQHGWSVVAIDAELDEKWQHPLDLLPSGCRFMGFRGDMNRFLVEGLELVHSSLCSISAIDHLVVICVEHGKNLDQLTSIRGRLGVTDLRVLYNNVPATVVSVSSADIIEDCPLKLAPKHRYVDEDILSSNKQVQVWNFQGSRRLTPASDETSLQTMNTLGVANVKSRPKIRSSEEGSVKNVLQPSAHRRVTVANSKVAQLQKQQKLAYQKRLELSEKEGIEHDKKSSIETTNDASHSLSKSQEAQIANSKPPRTSATKSFSDMVRRRRATIIPKKSTDIIDYVNRRAEGDDDPESSKGVLQTQSEDTIMSIMSLYTPDRSNAAPSIQDSVLDLVSPSCMPRSASERHARIHDIESNDNSLDLLRTMKREVLPASSGSLNTESTANSSVHEDETRDGIDPVSSLQEYEPGDFVEVKIGNIYQVGMIDKRCFKGIYNVTLFSDTPAWSKKRLSVDIYQQSPERMPEVLARDIRPFNPAPIGEVIYVFVNGNERKCCVHGYSYGNHDKLTARHMKYVVKFAKKDGDEWRSEKHRVPVQRAYRVLCDL